MKLFVFDVDNTLVSHFKGESYIPDSTKEAIKRIQANGYKCIIATGRSYNHTKPVMEELGILDAVLCNGSVIVESGIITQDIKLDSNVLHDILVEIEKHELPVLAFDENDMFVYDKNNGDRFEEMLVGSINSVGGELKDILKVLDFNQNYNLISVFTMHEFAKHDSISIIPWGDEGVEIISKDLNKGFGVNKYISKYNIAKSDVYVFGDNYNDISMFQEFYENSNALGNAPDDVKKHAAFVLDHIDDDGIFKAIDRIIGG